MNLVKKYLISDSEDRVCFHCHKNKPAAKKNICDKCSKELASWRAKKDGVKKDIV